MKIINDVKRYRAVYSDKTVNDGSGGTYVLKVIYVVIYKISDHVLINSV